MFMQKALLANELIDLEKLTKSEMMRLNGKKGFYCTKCKKSMVFKNGERKKAHFAHEKKGLTLGQSESAAHMFTKHAMAKWLRNQGIDAKVEERFVNIDRIADVYFKYKKSKYVLEIQKSPMSDLEFKQRNLDYQSLGVVVLWIFLGNVTKKENILRLPSVMLRRELERYLHFCVKTAKLRILEAPIFVSTRDVYAKSIYRNLNGFRVDDLLMESRGLVHFDDSWLEIKNHFRISGWFYVTKSEKKLLEQCLIRGFNLSLLPSEVGWPVVGDAWGTHLFVWQSYVLLTLMKHFHSGDFFTLDHLMRLLEIEYKVMIHQGLHKPIISYLKWLVMFGIIKRKQKYFEYIKLPRINLSMEKQRNQDKIFVEIVAKLWQV